MVQYRSGRVRIILNLRENVRFIDSCPSQLSLGAVCLLLSVPPLLYSFKGLA